MLLESPILLESELQAIASDKTLGSKSFKIFFEVRSCCCCFSAPSSSALDCTSPYTRFACALISF